MKHTLIAALVTLAFCSASFASEQTSTMSPSNEKMKVIPTVGYTYYNIQGSNADFKAKGGSSAAALIQFPYSSDFIFETGLEYFEASAKISKSIGIFDLDYAYIKINHLAVPLRMIYNINQPTSEQTHWFAKAGITPSYVMSGELETSGGHEDIKSELNSMNYLFHLGIGADWQVAPGGRIVSDLTYNYGLNKYSKSDEGRIVGLQIQIGYSVEL